MFYVQGFVTSTLICLFLFIYLRNDKNKLSMLEFLWFYIFMTISITYICMLCFTEHIEDIKKYNYLFNNNIMSKIENGEIFYENIDPYNIFTNDVKLLYSEKMYGFYDKKYNNYQGVLFIVKYKGKKYWVNIINKGKSIRIKTEVDEISDIVKYY